MGPGIFFGMGIAGIPFRTTMGNILIIDDDTQFLAVCRRLLEQEGYDVAEALDGNSGIEICRRESIDLVITDILMPKKEGLETIMELRMNFPSLRIIAVSGGGRLGPDSYLPLAAKMGAHKVLGKPFTRNELLQTVNDALQHTD